MRLTACLRRFRPLMNPRVHRRRLVLEVLEDRTVPSILFNTAATTTTNDEGGLVLDHVHVELIFWGSGWDTGQGPTLRAQTEAAVQSITAGPYLAYLSQYRPDIGSGSWVGSVTIDSSNPGAVFHDSDVENLLTANIVSQTLPDPASDPELLYAVIPQPGSSSNAGGFHSYLTLGSQNVHYLWTTDTRGIDGLSVYFSHELAESVSDPEGTAIQVNPRNDYAWNEIGDGTEAQSYTYRLNGYLVQSWFSQADHAYVVPTGQTENFWISNRTTRVLTVDGGQLDNPDDTITIDQQNGSYIVILDGETAQFDAFDFFTGRVAVSSITVNTGNGDDTVNVEQTISGRPVTLNLGGGNNTVNISPAAQDLSRIAETITINGGSGSDALVAWDHNSTLGRTFTISNGTINATGGATLMYNNLSSLTILGGNGGNVFNLQGSSAAVTLQGGSGINTLVGINAAEIWNILAADTGTLTSSVNSLNVTFSRIQNLFGGNENDQFVFSDGATISGNVSASGAGAIDYSAYTNEVLVNLQMSTAAGIGGTFAGIQSFTGGSGNNTLIGADVTNAWNVTGSNSGTVYGAGSVAFQAFQNLTGGSAANTFTFSDGAGISGNLDGQGGTLDYSGCSSTVIVDLQTGTATGVGGTIVNITNVVGGNGGGSGVYNILVGNGGNTLIGGDGRRNLLIAGATASTLNGGDDEDILIGGTTAYDMDVASLMAIMDYWSGST
ncbi:MAG TPA: hypothetical protein VKU02_15135, partial [Gemmataceae bacterium]|nr:hypothetical protein [Gemmataceae bacterium]